MKAADMIIDIGPEAGTHMAVELVAQGTYNEILKTDSLTAKYLNEKEEISVPKTRRKFKNHIEVIGAEKITRMKNFTFPLECLTVITGVSGSGKSTLVKRFCFQSFKRN